MTLEDVARLPDRISELEREIKALKAAANTSAKLVYTVKEAAEYMCVSTTVIYEWLRSGKLKAFRLNRDSKTYRISRCDMDELIETLKGETV